MIRKGIPNRTVASSTFESGYRLDPMRSGITRDIRLPPKKGQARNYAMFLESPTNYTYYDVRRQYDWKTDRAYIRKETPKEAIARAREEYIKAVEQARGEPITIPYIEKIEKLALLDSLQKINLPEDQKGLLIEKFMDLENKLADIKLPDTIKQQIRASAYNQFLVSQSITPVQLIDPDTGKPSKLSITMAGASDLGDGDPSVVRMTEFNAEDFIKYLQQQKGKKGKQKVESSDLAGASLADQVFMELDDETDAQVFRDAESSRYFEAMETSSLTRPDIAEYARRDPERWNSYVAELQYRQLPIPDMEESGAGLEESPSIFRDQPSVSTFSEDDEQYSQAYEYFSKLPLDKLEKQDLSIFETEDARSAYRAFLDVLNMRQSMEKEATSFMEELKRQPKPSRAEGEERKEKKEEPKKEEKDISKLNPERGWEAIKLKVNKRVIDAFNSLPPEYKGGERKKGKKTLKDKTINDKKGGSAEMNHFRKVLKEEFEGFILPAEVLQKIMIYAKKNKKF